MSWGLVVAVVLPALVLVAYASGLGGPFVLDDWSSVLVDLVAVPSLTPAHLRDAAFSGAGGWPSRALARMSFAVSYLQCGGSFCPVGFKLFNVLVHSINAVLVFSIARLLLRRMAWDARIAGAATGWGAMPGALPLVMAAIWALHPIQLTSVLYTVQRMTALSATFVFAGLAVFVWGRTRFESSRAGSLGVMATGVGAGTVLGVLCKETAVVLPALAYLTESVFFRRELLTRAARGRLAWFYGLSVAAPLILAAIVALLAWDRVLDMYLVRDFTLVERLMSESRALVMYVALIVFPYLDMLTLHHDDFEVSRGLLRPWTTAPALVFVFVLAVIAIYGVRRQSLGAFAIAWFAIGHVPESTILGLELVFEHRNYVPSFGIVFVGVFWLSRILDPLGYGRPRATAVLAVLIAVLGAVTASRADIWSQTGRLFARAVETHPGSSRANGDFAAWLGEAGGTARDRYRFWYRAAILDPGEVLALTEMLALVREQRAAGAAASSSAPGTGHPRVAAVLPVTAVRLAGAELSIGAEIGRRLRVRPLQSSTVATLGRLSQCIVSGDVECQGLVSPTRDWLRLAIDNPRGRARERAAAALYLGRLSAYAGDVAGALGAVRRAINLAPRELSHRIELVSLYLALGEHGAAGLALAELEQMRHPFGFRDGDIDRLRRQLAYVQGEPAASER